MKYTIKMVGDERLEFDPMSRRVAIAKIAELKKEYPDSKFFLMTGGNGGMGCYLNPDGDHDITGKAW